MNVAEAEAFLSSLDVSSSDADLAVGTSGRPPYDYAYLQLTSPSDPGQFARISTPGIRWFTLEVSGGFANNDFDDMADDPEARAILRKYLDAAVAYLEGRWSVGRSRLFGIPFVTVDTKDGPLKLTLSEPAKLKYVLRLRDSGTGRVVD